VPGGNTSSNDPNLSSVALTDVRRVESAYPVQFGSIAYASVSLPYSMIDGDYHVAVDVLSFKGGATQKAMVYPGDKAANGFKLYAEGTLDMVSVRWTALKMSL
jgi:hypothetical protein